MRSCKDCAALCVPSRYGIHSVQAARNRKLVDNHLLPDTLGVLTPCAMVCEIIASQSVPVA